MSDLRSIVIGVSAYLCLTATVFAQSATTTDTQALEEIVVTAMRVATNLQQTPLSVRALTGERLELSGIDAGRDLGIMVPNAVFSPNPSGELQSQMVIRGLPGVETYIDGVSFGSLGFLQGNFVELERVEVLRGPQGTHFGRNTNGGAIQLITRRPADDFGVRFDVELGDLDRRVLKVAADVPISDRIKTKFIAAGSQVDGFLDSQTIPFKFGGERETLLRADLLWEPTNTFSLRANVTQQNNEGSEARIVRISNTQSPFLIAYNVLAGNPAYLAQARAIDPNFPSPPFPLAGDRFAPETHEPGYPGGSLGRWQTRSNVPGPTSVVDGQRAMVTLNWRMTDHWTLESLSSYATGESMQIVDWDSSEFTQALQIDRTRGYGVAEELHVLGNHFGGRVRTLLALYNTRGSFWEHPSSWWFWDFAVPNTGPAPPEMNPAAVGYVRAWGATVGNPVLASFVPLTFFSDDEVLRWENTDRAIFGELTIGFVKGLDMTLGFRVTQDTQWGYRQYLPADSLRSAEPGRVSGGDLAATGALLNDVPSADLGRISTPRASLSYQANDDVYLYASYAAGFTAGEIVHDDCAGTDVVLRPEVVDTREIGLRSEWLDNHLRFNATYFNSHWDHMRVPKTVFDANGQPLPCLIQTDGGVAKAFGLEFELDYVPSQRWELNFALGLLDSKYLDIGNPPPNGTGLQPGIPFAFAPKTSYSIGLRYKLPLRDGSALLLRGDYGWMDDYQRQASAEFQTNKPEPAYGLLNARIIYTPAHAKWQLSFFGTNLTNAWYVNGGFNLGYAWGYDAALIGRPREVGVGVHFSFD